MAQWMKRLFVRGGSLQQAFETKGRNFIMGEGVFAKESFYR